MQSKACFYVCPGCTAKVSFLPPKYNPRYGQYLTRAPQVDRESVESNLVIITDGARSSAGRVMTNYVSHIIKSSTLNVNSFRYLFHRWSQSPRHCSLQVVSFWFCKDFYGSRLGSPAICFTRFHKTALFINWIICSRHQSYSIQTCANMHGCTRYIFIIKIYGIKIWNIFHD